MEHFVNLPWNGLDMANTTIFGDTQKNIQKMLPPKDKNNKESNISNTKDKIIK